MGGYRLPFAGPPIQREQSNIPGLLINQGNAAADAALRSGAIWGGAAQQLGQIGAGAVQQHQEQKAQSARSKAFEAAIASGDPKRILAVLGPKDGPAVINALRAMQPDAIKQYGDRMLLLRDAARGVLAVPPDKRLEAYAYARGTLLQNGVVSPEEAPEQFDESRVRQAAAYGETPKATGPLKGGPGDVYRDPDTLEVLATNPAEAKPDRPHVVGRALVDDAGKVIYRDPEAPKTQERFWVFRNGKPIRIAEGEYQAGDLPANTREQGRPVTSGDAGRVSDLDTSLDDVDVLEQTLTETKGATGTKAKAGAMLPNFVTELTGWGEDAKKRQAVIDRVKQVIGKALEEGVLRKEDEYKYEKILPTIGDTQAVAASKIAGLRKAVTQRRETMLSALEDAGYDVAKYRARKRTPAPPTLTPEDDALLQKYGY